MKKLIAFIALVVGLSLVAPAAADAQTPIIPPNPACTTTHPNGEVRQTWNTAGCRNEVVYPEYGKTLAVSPGGAYRLVYQTDGNLVEYGPGGSVVFDTRTAGYVSNGGTYFLMSALNGTVGISTNVGRIWIKYKRGTLLPKPVAGQALSIRIDAAGTASVFTDETFRYSLRAQVSNRDTAAL